MEAEGQPATEIPVLEVVLPPIHSEATDKKEAHSEAIKVSLRETNQEATLMFNMTKDEIISFLETSTS